MAANAIFRQKQPDFLKKKEQKSPEQAVTIFLLEILEKFTNRTFQNRGKI